MTRNRWIQTVCGMIVVLLVVGAGALLHPIDQRRGDLQLGGLGGAQQLPPGETAAAAGLAIVRGLAVDWLWIRANQMKEDGEFFEMDRLARLITSLQPRFPQVWSFQAWNMAYNISVMTHTPQERWDWVSKGITLLRDKGIPYNPKAIRLYRELGWIYFHKVGQYSDDMHWYYKTRHAMEWQEVMGPPPASNETEEWIKPVRAIRDAPDTLEALYAQSPEAKALVDELAKLGHKPDIMLLRRAGAVMSLTYSLDASFLGATTDRLSEPDRALMQTLQDPRFAPGVGPLLSHLRRRALIDHYHMRPDRMVTLMETYGPLDWRHPMAHAMYWHDLGTDEAAELRNKKDIDLLNTYRGIIHANQEMMFRGRVSFDYVSQQIDLLPDPRFIDSYEKAVLDAKDDLQLLGVMGFGASTNENFDAGHENFLATAVTFEYLYGQEEKAAERYRKLREKFGPKDAEKPPGQERYGNKTLEEFIFAELSGNWDLMYNTRQFIDAMFNSAFQRGLTVNDRRTFDRFIWLAREAHNKYREKNDDPAATDTRARMSLPPFEQMLAESYLNFMRQPTLNPLMRFRVWVFTPDQLRRPVYDRLREPMRAMAVQGGLDPDKAFPEPPGMEEWRAANPAQPETPERGPAQIETK